MPLPGKKSTRARRTSPAAPAARLGVVPVRAHRPVPSVVPQARKKFSTTLGCKYFLRLLLLPSCANKRRGPKLATSGRRGSRRTKRKHDRGQERSPERQDKGPAEGRPRCGEEGEEGWRLKYLRPFVCCWRRCCFCVVRTRLRTHGKYDPSRVSVCFAVLVSSALTGNRHPRG